MVSKLLIPSGNLRMNTSLVTSRGKRFGAAIVLLFSTHALAATDDGNAAQPAIDSAALAARVQAEADRALIDLELNAARVSQTEREQLFEVIQADVRAYFVPVRQRFNEAKLNLQNRIGVVDGIINIGDNLGSIVGLTEGEYLKDLIEKTLAEVRVDAALVQLQSDLDTAVERRAIDLYSAHRLQFSDVLRTLVAQNDLPQAARDQLLNDLLQQILAENIALAKARGEPVVEATFDVPIGTLAGGAALVATRSLIRQRFAQQVGGRVGASFAARAIGGRAASLLVPGVGWAVFVAGLGYDLWNLSSSTAEAATNAVDTTYRAVETELLIPKAIQPLVDNIAASTEDLLGRDLESTRAALVGSFENVLHQVRSPGIVEVVGDLPAEAVYRLVKDVALAFGTGYLDIDMRLKRQIVADGGAERSRILLERYGLQFVDLFQRFPRATGKMMRHDAGLDLLDAVMTAPNRETELDTIDRALARYPNLDGTHARAFLLVRGLMPEKSLNEVSGEALAAMAPVLDQLTQLRSARQQTAKLLVGAVLSGDVGPVALRTLDQRRIEELATLAEAMVAVGGGRYVELAARPGSDWILHFLSDFPGEHGLKMLREDPGFLQVYAGSRRGKLAVEARIRLIAEQGPLDPAQDRALTWVLGQLSPRSQVTASYIDDLVALGIPDGPWPNFLAVPVARITAYLGLTAVVVLLGALLVMPPLLAWWRFFGRVGRRRRAQPHGQPKLPIDVTSVPQTIDGVLEAKR